MQSHNLYGSLTFGRSQPTFDMTLASTDGRMGWRYEVRDYPLTLATLLT